MKPFSPFRILDDLAKFEFDFVAEKQIKTSKDKNNNYCETRKLAKTAFLIKTLNTHTARIPYISIEVPNDWTNWTKYRKAKAYHKKNQEMEVDIVE